MMKRRLFTSIFAGLALLALPLSCTKEEERAALLVQQDIWYAPAEASEIEVPVWANKIWRLDFKAVNWLSTNIYGGQPSTRSFIVSVNANTGGAVRYCDISVLTMDGEVTKSVRIVQYPATESLAFGVKSILVSPEAGEQTVPVTSDVTESSLVGIKSNASWISALPLPEELDSASFSFDAFDATGSESLRAGNVVLLYQDEFDRFISDTLRVVQYAGDMQSATPVSFDEARTVYDPSDLTVWENVRIEGHMTLAGESPNYASNEHETNMGAWRYIVEDDDSNVLIFESSMKLDVSRYDKVNIRLIGLTVKEYTEGSFRYTVYDGLSPAAVSAESGTFTPREVTLSEIGIADVFTLVTVKDVEIVPLHGAFTNFKETSPSFSATSTTHTLYTDYVNDAGVNIGKINWMKSYPEYYRYFPTLIRDKQGGISTLHVAPYAPFAHESYPAGAGTITGLVMREVNTNFDLDESSIGIRPLERSDISLNGERYSETLVDFDFSVANASTRDYITAVDGVDRFLPAIQQTTSSTPCTFMKVGAAKIASGYSGETTIGFQDCFRGDVGGTLTNGNNLRSKGITTQVLSTSLASFEVYDLCTAGISGGLYLYVELGASCNNPGNPPRGAISYSFDGNTWTSIPDANVKFLCQLDRAGSGETNYREPTNVPGQKSYCFNLPDECCNCETLYLKVAQTVNQSTAKTLRIGNIAVKYNK